MRRWGTRGILGAVILGSVTVMSIFAPLFAPQNPAKQDYRAILHAPSAQHLLGTDQLGRDVLSRLIYGARISLEVGSLAVVVALVFGIVLGLPAGYFGGRVDRIITSFLDALLAFPALVLALAITAALGPGVNNLIIAIGVTSTPAFARVLRAQVLTVRGREFVTAARALGASDWRIVQRHVLPNTISPLIVQASLSVGFAILTEAGLSFLGLGVRPPTPSWGSMLHDAYSYLAQAPWFPLSSGLIITLTVLGSNFLGDALRDALDVRGRGIVR